MQRLLPAAIGIERDDLHIVRPEKAFLGSLVGIDHEDLPQPIENRGANFLEQLNAPFALGSEDPDGEPYLDGGGRERVDALDSHFHVNPGLTAPDAIP